MVTILYLDRRNIQIKLHTCLIYYNRLHKFIARKDTRPKVELNPSS